MFWVKGILRPLKIIYKLMIIRVGSNMTKNIVETKPLNNVIANLLLYLHIRLKIWSIYVSDSHQVRITYNGKDRLKNDRSHHEKRVQIANISHRGGGDEIELTASEVKAK